MTKHKGKEKFNIHRTLPKPGHKPSPSETKLGPEAAQELKRPLWKRLLVSFLLALLAFFIFIGSWDAINISRASSQIFGSGNLLSLIAGTDAKSQNGRINLLLVGYSIDDPGHPGATLTDSLLLLSMSSKTHSGYMLSIPRDLYVKIPGFGY